LELESFRNKWRAEVSARTKVADSKRHEPGGSQGPSHPSKPAPRRPSIVPKTSTTKKSTEEEEEEEEEEVSEEEDGHSASKYIVDRRTSVAEDADLFSKASAREPRSALEHYERAVEKETQGSLGESLSLYRKAFRVCRPSSANMPLESDLTNRWTMLSIKNIGRNTSLHLILPRNLPM
jgi:F-box protein 9